MSYQLTIEPLGQTVDIAEGQSILDAALRAGIYLPHACGHGLCATCKVQVLDGEVEHGEASSFALMDFEREEGKCLACCASAQGDVVIEAEIEEDPDAENLPVRDYPASVSRIERLTPTIKAVWLRLDAPEGMCFQAGQYVNLALPEGIGSRAFSIASAPQAGGEIELNIRIVPGGRGTGYVHERLAVGDRLSVSGPYGRFFVKKSADLPVIFMAGGSGLSSPRAMILDLLAEGFAKPITLVYGQRNREELYYHDEFLALEQRHANFRYVPALSHEPEGSDWRGFRGFVHEAARECFGNDFRGHKAYLCGPPLMIDSCIDTLMQGRLFERDIYTEKFISAADAQQVRSPLFKAI
ncbi:Multi-component phenol hydoxylase, reductase subunit; LapP [Azotobacter vinelandii CA]|uniref:Multi-component phenol hydoxylase, reductase subunit LapP n=2 Tax=Azotobacter vinelandii TaxID=354 RepID=C1DN69_AZOVD|nr:phenol 2-monooxygenase domain-containing protein [Azotobacter vinelandii]ACO79236.1 Multi-component phenol hydoxylase, reductase subunit; LapP [Azotobacter vinelandii DJ]AGK13664.1 Multi-component phenol hydoxylase, reductase subunit; LapP [Azotobacter vinelandii CA]AGK18189.1 Multi-component phenol hydoxylase, reductase subunit; LapP [Azotobacter vinelandii CA6]SFX96211.1 phenol 2-monooxygenase P5 subunit [Azotobacter vinelandii]GLK61151.1 phenol hydroxylase P5 protein [Azotobacter vinelan